MASTLNFFYKLLFNFHCLKIKYLKYLKFVIWFMFFPNPQGGAIWK